MEYSAAADSIRFIVRVADRTALAGTLTMRAGRRRTCGLIPCLFAPWSATRDRGARLDAGLRRAKPVVAEWISKRERGSALLLRLMTFVSLRLGRTLSRPLLYGIALYFFLFAPDARRHSLRYLRLALGRSPTMRDRFRHILYFASAIHDRVYLINEQYENFDITIEGESLMRAQLQSGRGAFLMGAHLGSFELMRSVGQRQPGLKVSMAMYEHNARKLNAILGSINPAARPDIISLGQIDAMLHLAERLDRRRLRRHARRSNARR